MIEYTHLPRTVRAALLPHLHPDAIEHNWIGRTSDGYRPGTSPTCRR
jgi:hypothetical protein